MRFSTRNFAAVAAAALLAGSASAQTSTSCDPTENSSCPADAALGGTSNVDFTQGESKSYSIVNGVPTYSSNGVGFTVAKEGDSPTLQSDFYIMFGKVEFSMMSAPGVGIISSFSLLSDDLDEIDFEVLGAEAEQVQTNYFYRGSQQSASASSNGLTTNTANTQTGFLDYVIEWTDSQIIWTVNGVSIRTLAAGAAVPGYPQTPMRLKFGVWAGGDPSNPPGTINWAGGVTDYGAGPFNMYIKDIQVTDYSTGSSYTYNGPTWQDVTAVGGAVNGNLGAVVSSVQPTATAVGSPTTVAGSVPTGSVSPSPSDPPASPSSSPAPSTSSAPSSSSVQSSTTTTSSSTSSKATSTVVTTASSSGAGGSGSGSTTLTTSTRPSSSPSGASNSTGSAPPSGTPTPSSAPGTSAGAAFAAPPVAWLASALAAAYVLLAL